MVADFLSGRRRKYCPNSYLVRLLFCLLAEDTSIFDRQQFQDLIEQRTAEDGSDLAQWLGSLFEVLNTKETERLANLDEQLAAFPYVNGHLFAERLRTASFDTSMRESAVTLTSSTALRLRSSQLKSRKPRCGSWITR
jgi:hypothetical protein